MRKILSIVLGVTLCVVPCPAQTFDHLAPVSYFSDKLEREAEAEAVAIGNYLLKISQRRVLDPTTLSRRVAKKFRSYYRNSPQMVRCHFDQIERGSEDALIIPLECGGREYVMTVALKERAKIAGDVAFSFTERENAVYRARVTPVTAVKREGIVDHLRRFGGRLLSLAQDYLLREPPLEPAMQVEAPLKIPATIGPGFRKHEQTQWSEWTRGFCELLRISGVAVESVSIWKEEGTIKLFLEVKAGFKKGKRSIAFEFAVRDDSAADVLNNCVAATVAASSWLPPRAFPLAVRSLQKPPAFKDYRPNTIYLDSKDTSAGRGESALFNLLAEMYRVGAERGRAPVSPPTIPQILAYRMRAFSCLTLPAREKLLAQLLASASGLDEMTGDLLFAIYPETHYPTEADLPKLPMSVYKRLESMDELDRHFLFEESPEFAEFFQSFQPQKPFLDEATVASMKALRPIILELFPETVSDKIIKMPSPILVWAVAGAVALGIFVGAPAVGMSQTPAELAAVPAGFTPMPYSKETGMKQVANDIKAHFRRVDAIKMLADQVKKVLLKQYKKDYVAVLGNNPFLISSLKREDFEWSRLLGLPTELKIDTTIYMYWGDGTVEAFRARLAKFVDERPDLAPVLKPLLVAQAPADIGRRREGGRSDKIDGLLADIGRRREGGGSGPPHTQELIPELPKKVETRGVPVAPPAAAPPTTVHPAGIFLAKRQISEDKDVSTEEKKLGPKPPAQTVKPPELRKPAPEEKPVEPRPSPKAPIVPEKAAVVRVPLPPEEVPPVPTKPPVPAAPVPVLVAQEKEREDEKLGVEKPEKPLDLLPVGENKGSFPNNALGEPFGLEDTVPRPDEAGGIRMDGELLRGQRKGVQFIFHRPQNIEKTLAALIRGRLTIGHRLKFEVWGLDGTTTQFELNANQLRNQPRLARARIKKPIMAKAAVLVVEAGDVGGPYELTINGWGELSPLVVPVELKDVTMAKDVAFMDDTKGTSRPLGDSYLVREGKGIKIWEGLESRNVAGLIYTLKDVTAMRTLPLLVKTTVLQSKHRVQINFLDKNGKNLRTRHIKPGSLSKEFRLVKIDVGEKFLVKAIQFIVEGSRRPVSVVGLGSIPVAAASSPTGPGITPPLSVLRSSLPLDLDSRKILDSSL